MERARIAYEAGGVEHAGFVDSTTRHEVVVLLPQDDRGSPTSPARTARKVVKAEGAHPIYLRSSVCNHARMLTLASCLDLSAGRAPMSCSHSVSRAVAQASPIVVSSSCCSHPVGCFPRTAQSRVVGWSIAIIARLI